MIDNPLPYQVEKDNDEIYLTNQYYEHCADKAHEIAKEFDLLPEFYDDFAEYFTDLCLDSDEGYSLINDKSLIDMQFIQMNMKVGGVENVQKKLMHYLRN